MTANRGSNTPESGDEILSAASSGSLAARGPAFSSLGRSLSRLRPVAEEVELPSPGHEGNGIHVVSLNLGGRNTNPVEFEIKGDNSATATEAVAILRKAAKALKSAEEGPLLMPESEMMVVKEILAQIFSESLREDGEDDEWHPRIKGWLRFETWQQVLSAVRSSNVHLFNALNLYTLKLNRPSVWENPASCQGLTNTLEYLAAWKAWYTSLDREGQFWLADAPRVSSKRGMEVSAAFAGLLLFDVMCLCSARRAINSGMADSNEDFGDEGRHVPFKELAKFAAQLPASSLTARHAVAKKFTEGASAVLAQEARNFAEHPSIADEFLPPFCAADGFTAVFLRKDAFVEAVDISAAVAKRMEALTDAKAPALVQRAWRTSASRLAAVCCVSSRQRGGGGLQGSRVCLVSLHVSKSDCTAAFIETLRDVLQDYDADINIVGMDSNCVGSEAAAFQKRLWSAGLDLGCTAKQDQVTTAKARTSFQTQVQKVGESDVSHKDYIVSWTSAHVRRGATSYTPSLRTSYGVEQETKQCMRLPTTAWPFDHCGIATSFTRRYTCTRHFRCSRWLFCRLIVAALVLFLGVSPTLSGSRPTIYGPPGDWYTVAFMHHLRFGICEAEAWAPCAEGWLENGGSCYLTTPERMGYASLQEFCQERDSHPVIIESEEENQFVVDFLCPESTFCYIGLHNDYDGESFWVSGEALNYTRLANLDKKSIPVFDHSRTLTYRATIISNMPSNVTGCDARYGKAFEEGSTFGPFMIGRILAPCIALLVSAVVWALPRSREQRLANRVLGSAIAVNMSWFLAPLFNSCFADDFKTHESFSLFAAFMEAGGRTTTSLISLWMIVRRMCLLYTRTGLKAVYWANVTLTILFYMTAILVVDSAAPLSMSWAVLLLFTVEGCIFVTYIETSVVTCRDLYRTWAFLHKEATGGLSSRGTELRSSVRSAKLHFYTVMFAIVSGALRWAAIAAILLMRALVHDGYPFWADRIYTYATFLDSVTNDVCVHVLAVMKMDDAIRGAKGISAEVAERADREVEQHRLAVRMLKAAPTSTEQLQQFARLEQKARAAIGTEQEKQAFLILQSAVGVEAVRIHRLMLCVRARAMTLELRYQYLIDVPAYGGPPRQHVPQEFAKGDHSEAAAEKYFDWLYGEASGAQEALFQQVTDSLATFNGKHSPTDLGLPEAQFPWRIWASDGDKSALAKGEVISPGMVLKHCPRRARCFGQDASALCVVLEEETSADLVTIHRSGHESPEKVPRSELRNCRGGGVFVPGPQKKKHRSLDKIKADYEDAEWPPAASLVDVCRCMVLCDDPYAMAVFVAYLQKHMKVLRVKNRFSEDVCDSKSAGELQAMFSAAAASVSDTASESQITWSTADSYAGDQQYRDVSMNVQVKSPNGIPFVCEVQVTLSNLAILKKADQALYTIRRMKAPSTLKHAYTFSKGVDDGVKA